jgi:disulfide bond formation protein DsbB
MAAMIGTLSVQSERCSDMDTTAYGHIKRSGRLRLPDAAAAALVVFAAATATILGAWYFQLAVKLPPCPLCLEERWPYYIAIPLSLAVTAAALRRVPRPFVGAGLLAVIGVMLWSTALGAYHAGVEWHFWRGPADCSGPMGDFSAHGSLLDQLKSVHLVRCDEAAWRFLGMSLAGYNALISLALAAIAALGLVACLGAGRR